MLESMIMLVAGLGMIFTILMVLSDKEQPIFGILAMSVWFMCAAFIISVDIPYSHLYGTTENYTVVSGTSATTVAAPLRWLFTGLGFICLAYSMIMVLYMILIPFLKKRKLAREK